MKIAPCKKCTTPIIRWDEVGLTQHADLTALSHPDLAHAWLNGHTTYKVRTLHRTQWVNQYWPSPINRTHLAHALRKSQPTIDTILAKHTCRPHTINITQALATWQPRDAAALCPHPTPVITPEGMPF